MMLEQRLFRQFNWRAVAGLTLGIAALTSTPYGARATELHEGLVGFWALDDAAGNVAAETFGAIQDVGELRGEPVWLKSDESRLGDSSLLFDGLAQDVLIPQSDDLDIGTNAVSLSAWINPDFLPSEQAEAFAGIYDSVGDNYVLYMDKSAQELRFKVTDVDGNAERPGVPESQLTPGAWNHVLGVYDGANGAAKIYFNGALMDTHLNPNLTGLVMPGQIASIGANTTDNPEVPVSRFFSGAIDDVAVWNRPLGVAEAAYLYNEGMGMSVGAENPDIAFISDEVVVTPVAPTAEPVVYLGFDGDLLNSGTGGMDYDGTLLDMPDLNDALYTDSANGQALDLRENPVSSELDGDSVVVDYVMTDDGTIVFDYNVGEYYNFQSLWTNSVDANDWEMWIYNDGRVRGRVDGNSFVEFNLDNLSGIGETYQIAFTWERDTENTENVAVKLFVDGEQRDQDLEGNWIEPGDSVFIGGGDGTNHYGNGVWDEFRIYDTALSAGEVLYLFGTEDVATCDPNSIGDLNGNGEVDFPDFLILSGAFGTDVATQAEGDIDCNGTVEFADFLVLSRNFGKTSTVAAAAVPEPSGLLLLGAAFAFAGTLRRRRTNRR